MKRHWLVLIVLCLLLMPVSPAMSQWIGLSKSIQELDIHSITVDPKNSSSIISASEKQIFKSRDGGASWKQVMSVRGGSNRIHSVYFDELNAGLVYAATEKGVYRSDNSGEKWQVFFKGIGDAKARTRAVLNYNEKIVIGTDAGVYAADLTGKGAQKSDIPSVPIRHFVKADDVLYALSDQGIYKSSDGLKWHLLLQDVRAEQGSASLEQFQIEEMISMPKGNLAYAPLAKTLFFGSKEGLLQFSKDGVNWDSVKGQPFRKIHAMTGGAATFFAATDTGIYRWLAKEERFEELYIGLESKEVNTLLYNPANDSLLAGTKSGLFKYSHPEFGLNIPLPVQTKPASSEWLKQFENEPTIAQVQKAAIRYAEVQPEKIESWRRAASRKAYLPSVSFSRGFDEDENIDIDRGGTADPDKFIYGPPETSTDWSVSLNWDLGELIWNDDQTSIDTRSRLLVELRDDILSKVTHLYYERRRLQIDMALSANKEFPHDIENIIKLQELTAGIDALTGGYFSKTIEKNGKD